MVKPSTTSTMHSPGGTRYHQAPREMAPSAKADSRMLPQEILKGSPRPRKERVVSVRMATATTRMVLAKIRGKTLGRMWRGVIWRWVGARGGGGLTEGPPFGDRNWAATNSAVPRPGTRGVVRPGMGR